MEQAEIEREAPKYEAYGINIEERGDMTHVFKDGQLVGSFSIDLDNKQLKFTFPENRVFNYFAYIASDLTSNRIKWVNENLQSDSLDQIEAGVAFLGFAKFEELMAYELGEAHGESIH